MVEAAKNKIREEQKKLKEANDKAEAEKKAREA